MVISIDAELGWGFHDFETPPQDRLEAGREGWRTLLDIFETYDVPATWAVVGHLFLEDCDGIHADHPAPDGWFDWERGRWRNRPDLRFGTDLIEELIESPVGHEVGSQSFSHVLFDDPMTTRDLARAEIEASINAAAPFGIDFDSFIFPRNAVGHLDVLADAGFSCYRSNAPRPDSRVGRSAAKLASVLDPGRIQLVEPTVGEYGLVDIPPSLYLFGYEGWPRALAESVGTDPIVRQATHAIDRAARNGGIFHAWLHPNNIRSGSDADRIRAIVEYAAETRSEGNFRIETMGAIAEQTLSRKLGPVAQVRN